MRKTIQMMKASSVIIVCGILLHGCFDGWDAVDYDSFWGTKQEDLVGAWKADGTNYGKRYKSDAVSVETIRTLRLELFADGAFKAENWPFMDRSKGQVEIVSVFHGSWTYEYRKDERLGYLRLRSFETLPFNYIGASAYWEVDLRKNTLRVNSNFADFLYLEKEMDVKTESKALEDQQQ